MNIFNVFSARFFAAAKLCVFSFVLVNLPFSVNAQSADLHSQTNHYSNDILEAKKEEAHKKRRRLEQLTLTLAKQIKQRQNENKNNKNSIDLNQLNDLIDTAQSRQTLISELLEHSPNAVKRSKLPNKISKHAPIEIKQYLLQQQELEGELEIFYEDYEQVELSRLRHVLNTKAGRVELHFENTKSLSKLKHGSKVKAKGLFVDKLNSKDSAAALIESQTEVALLADDGSKVTTASVSPAQLENTLGEQKTLVLLVNFQDNPSEQPWTVDQVQDMIFGTVNDYYKEASYGQTWLAGDVKGFYTLPIDATCEHGTIASAVQLVMSEQAINTSDYQRLIYVFPKSDNCGWTGKGTVGGNPSKSWVNGDLTLRTFGHELGHNLGLRHAKRIDCGSQVLADNCSVVEYGDAIEIMGSLGFTGHFNSFNKEQLGWLTTIENENSAKISLIDTSGSFELEPYESTPSSIAKTLKIQRGVDNITGEILWYYLEYRQAIGFDSYLSSFPKITSGILFHTATGTDLNTSYLLDMTPESAVADWNDSVLPVDAIYEDFGIVITPEWANSNGTSINITINREVCISQIPQINLISESSNWGAAGETVVYQLEITNMDSLECESSDFYVSINAPLDWEFSSHSLTMLPGETRAVVVEVISSINAEDGYYELDFKVENNTESDFNNTVSTTYTIDNPELVCVRGLPTIELNSLNNEIFAGESVNYLAVLTNNDSIECETSSYRLNTITPENWTATTELINLSPQESKNIELQVTSSVSALSASYYINFIAENLDDERIISSTFASVVIKEPAKEPINTAPILIDDNVTIVSKSSILIDVLSNDKDMENDQLLIVSVTQGDKGAVKILAEGKIEYTPVKSFKNRDSFNYTVSDGEHQINATVYVELITTESSKGNGKKRSK